MLAEVSERGDSQRADALRFTPHHARMIFIVATLLGDAPALVVADLKANLGHVRYHVKKTCRCNRDEMRLGLANEVTLNHVANLARLLPSHTSNRNPSYPP
jgi:hypothetical protein